MIEILEAKPITDHTNILKTLNAFLHKIDRCMYCNATYDIDMDTDVITIDITFIQLSYHFNGNLHAKTLADIIEIDGINLAANKLFDTVAHLILNEIYLKMFSKPIDE